MGVAGFIVAVRVAWHSDNPTTLLVVSTVLVLAAMLLGPDWERIKATGGGYEFELQRRRVDEVVEAVTESDSLDEVKARVGSVEQQIAMVESAAPPRSSSGWWDNLQSLWRGVSSAWPQIDRPLTSHLTLGDSVHLTLLMPASNALYRAACVVTDPHGAAHNADATQVRSVVPGTAAYTVSYPQDFPSAELLPGRYEAQWRLRPFEPTLTTPPVDIVVHRFSIHDTDGAPELDDPTRAEAD
jgi:hypothetical protein